MQSHYLPSPSIHNPFAAKKCSMLASVTPAFDTMHTLARRRPFFAAFLLAVFLSVQLAAAAYARTGTQYAVTPTDPMAGMTESCPDMAAMAQEDGKAVLDGLCANHCQTDSRSADHSAPQLPLFLPVLVSVVEPSTESHIEHLAVHLRDIEPRAPPRPLSILHCCFRT